ncbi:hypothetical protein CLOM_g10439, partial [Closterium sp. NIES-68]
LSISFAVWSTILLSHGAASQALLDGWEPLGSEAKDQRALALYRSWESAYGLQRGSLLPPSPLSLPPDLPPPPHLTNCAARTLAREVAEGGPWRGGGGGGRGGEREGTRWEDTWQQTGGQEENPPECCDWLPPRTPWVHGTDASNLALTRVAQRDIWAHQMLTSAAVRGEGGGRGGGTCEGRRLLVVPWVPSDRHVSADPFHTVASQIHVMADILGLAMLHNRTLVPLPGSYGPAANSDCKELNQTGEWTCFFFPLTHPACSSRVSHLQANGHMPTCLSLQAQQPPSPSQSQSQFQSQLLSQLQQHLASVQDVVCMDGWPLIEATTQMDGTSPAAAEGNNAGAAPASTAVTPAAAAAAAVGSAESAVDAAGAATPPAAAAAPAPAAPAPASVPSIIQAAAAAAVVSRWGRPHKEQPVMVDKQGTLHIMGEERAQLHWWRSQAVRFFLRWPSLHLCHVINREHHISIGLHVAASLAPTIASQASLLHSLSSGTTPGTTASTNTRFAIRYSKNLPNTSEEAAALAAAGKATEKGHALSALIASSFAASAAADAAASSASAASAASSASDASAFASPPSSLSSPSSSPDLPSLLHSPNSSLLETHVWVGRDGPKRVSVRVGGRVRVGLGVRGGENGGSEGGVEGEGSTSTMGRLCGAAMMTSTTVDDLIARTGRGELLTLDPVTIAVGGEPYLPRPIAAVHVSRVGEIGREETGRGGNELLSSESAFGAERMAAAAALQALQRLRWLSPDLRRVWLSGDVHGTRAIQQHLDSPDWALLYSTRTRQPGTAAEGAAAVAATTDAAAATGGEEAAAAAVIFADLLTSSLTDFLIADISTESGSLIHELRGTNGRLFSPVCTI